MKEFEVLAMLDAVVLAGTGKPDLLTEQEGVRNKAFIMLNGKPLLAYIIEAVSTAPSINSVVVAGPREELKALKAAGYSFAMVDEQDTMLDNLAAALSVVDQDRLSLIVTGDIPLITPDVIEKFLVQCQPYDQDLYYPVLTRESCLQRFPQTERTYVRLKEGFLTGGNVLIINPHWFLKNRSRLELFISYRKKPLKLLRILPPLFIIKYLMKTLSVRDLEKFLSKIFQLKAKAVFTDQVEIGVDVDKPGDLELIRETVAETVTK